MQLLVIASLLVIGAGCGGDTRATEGGTQTQTETRAKPETRAEPRRSWVDGKLAEAEPWHRVVTFDGTRWDLEYTPGDGDADSPEEAEAMARTFTRANWARLAAAPRKYALGQIDVVGQIGGDVVFGDDGDAYFQLWVTSRERKWRTIVWAEYCERTPLCVDLAKGDAVRVRGTVMGDANGVGASGEKLTAALVLGPSYRLSAPP